MPKGGLFLAATCAALLVVTAPQAGAAATRAEYAAQANVMCAKSEDQGRKLVSELPRQPPYRTAKRGAGLRFVKKSVVLLRRMEALDALLIAELKAIAPAPGDETLVAAWFVALDRTVELSVRTNAILVRLQRASYRFHDAWDPGEELNRKQRRLYAKVFRAFDQLERIFTELEPAVEASDGLANQLGAIECVAGMVDQGTPRAMLTPLRYAPLSGS
jgi:hypothetical protein